jgi:Meiotically up-regulated gene 113
MASVHLDPPKRSPFWYCAYRCANGERRFRSTREKDQSRAKLICKAWAEAERATSNNYPSPSSSSNSGKSTRVYFARSGNQIKIGAATNPQRRIESFRTARPGIKLLGHVAGGREVENRLHRQFSKDCLGGEWFCLTPELKPRALQARQGALDSLGESRSGPAQPIAVKVKFA